MKTLQQFLIVAGAFVLAYNGAMILHELGHAIAVWATLGRVDSISMSPLTWSITNYRVLEPRAAAWGGFLFGTTIPLVLFLTLWCLKSRLAFWALMLAAVAVMTNGTYMLVGTATGTGDSATLMRLGIAPRTLYVCGGALVAAGLPLVLPLGSLIGIGRTRTGFDRTLLVLGAPIFLYLLAILAFNLTVNSGEWRMWTTAMGAGTALLLAIATIAHLAADRLAGDETLRRAVPLGWTAALLSLAAGAAILAVEVLLFP